MSPIPSRIRKLPCQPHSRILERPRTALHLSPRILLFQPRHGNGRRPYLRNLPDASVYRPETATRQNLTKAQSRQKFLVTVGNPKPRSLSTIGAEQPISRITLTESN